MLSNAIERAMPELARVFVEVSTCDHLDTEDARRVADLLHVADGIARSLLAHLPPKPEFATPNIAQDFAVHKLLLCPPTDLPEGLTAEEYYALLVPSQPT